MLTFSSHRCSQGQGRGSLSNAAPPRVWRQTRIYDSFNHNVDPTIAGDDVGGHVVVHSGAAALNAIALAAVPVIVPLRTQVPFIDLTAVVGADVGGSAGGIVPPSDPVESSSEDVDPECCLDIDKVVFSGCGHLVCRCAACAPQGIPNMTMCPRCNTHGQAVKVYGEVGAQCALCYRRRGLVAYTSCGHMDTCYKCSLSWFRHKHPRESELSATVVGSCPHCRDRRGGFVKVIV